MHHSTQTPRPQRPAAVEPDVGSSVSPPTGLRIAPLEGRNTEHDSNFLDGKPQHLSSGSPISLSVGGSTTSLKRKQPDAPRLYLGSTTSTNTPITTLTSKNKRRKFFCGICNDDFSNTPSKHIRGHLVDICPSVRTAACTGSLGEEKIDCESFLLGCGYCGGTGPTELRHGEAFLGLKSLVAHVLEKHSTASRRLTWDLSKAMNNVLTSKALRADYEELRQSMNQLPLSTPLLWRWETSTEILLYGLEKLGGSLMDDQGDIRPLDIPDRVQIVASLEAAFVPIQSSSFASRGQVATHNVRAASAMYNIDLRPEVQNALIPSSTSPFTHEPSMVDHLSIARNDTFEMAQSSHTLISGQPIDNVLLNYDFSFLDSSVIPEI